MEIAFIMLAPLAITGNNNDVSVILLASQALNYLKMLPTMPIILSLNHNMKAVHSLHLKNAFAMCLSDTALSVYENLDCNAAVVGEAKNNAKNYEFSSMMCLFALASVLGCTIESYFPVTNDSAPSEEWDSLAKMFNCTVYPRQDVDVSLLDVIHIFRCAAMPQRYLVDRHIPVKKNHYVPLCQPSVDLEPGENYFQPKSILLPHYEAKRTSTSSSTTLASHESKRDGKAVGAKRKQLSLDMLFPKKLTKSSTQLVASSSNILPSTSSASKSDVVKEPAKTLPTIHSMQDETSNPKDIYNFVNKSSSLSDAQKYEVLTNTWKPESTYSFPLDGSSGRHFQHGWLTRFPWLAYSAAVNGGFCITCVLFGGESTHNASKLQRLMTLPFIPCTSSLSKLTKHAQKSKVHETATIRASEFKHMVENKAKPIDMQINNAGREIIERNRVQLCAIVGAIITCGRQNIPLRGH